MIEPNYIYAVTCLSVYDGDTATFDIDLGFNFRHQNQHFRLYGINTPEIKNKTKAGKARAIKARDHVAAAILGKSVRAQFFKNPSNDQAKQEKYGRFLAVVFYVNAAGVQINLNEELVTLGLAKVYLP